ncbi:hypothetical protein [Mesorhizobium sp. M0496]|uniref:hypothetical protein n=1 Tax=Mesorhizobium sp. M0496 TaxID=2956952 RepID=UPI003336B9D7
MDRVFDDLINALHPLPEQHWRAVAMAWALRLTGNLATGIAIGIGIAVGLVLAG